MKASFDFDGVLTEKSTQKYARELVNRGIDVYILTQRPPLLCKDVFDVALKVGLDIDHLIFAGVNPKEEYIEDLDPMFHLDDKEVFSDRLVVYRDGWKHECENRLQEYHIATQEPNTFIVQYQYKFFVTDESVWRWLKDITPDRVNYYEWKQIELMIRNR